MTPVVETNEVFFVLDSVHAELPQLISTNSVPCLFYIHVVLHQLASYQQYIGNMIIIVLRLLALPDDRIV